jgi:integrase
MDSSAINRVATESSNYNATFTFLTTLVARAELTFCDQVIVELDRTADGDPGPLWAATVKDQRVDVGASYSTQRWVLSNVADILDEDDAYDAAPYVVAQAKPSTVRGYRTSLNERILPLLGGRKLNSIVTADLQEIVDGWQVEGLAPSTIRNSLKPLQAIYRRARTREGLALNPTHDLELPSPNPAEVRIVAPEMAAMMLSVLPIEDRAIWATAIYAGLRYGELRALRWAAIDFASKTIRVRESWDPKEGSIAPKTRTSARTTPMPEAARVVLAELRSRRSTAPDGALAYAADDGSPFHAASIYRRADRAWEDAGIPGRLRLHQARHTYASFMIAAGVNAKALSVFMGHSSIKVTFDLYGHLMPGTESEAATLLDAYLDAQVQAMPEKAQAEAVL